MPTVSMKALLESGVHFGHRTNKWNPKMRPYIFTERNGIHIIDLQQTVKLLDDAFNFVRDSVSKGGTVLFVGTKRQAQETILEEAERAGMPYVNQRWLGGTLTNWVTIQQRLVELTRLEKMKETGEVSLLTKKEGLMIDRDILRLVTSYRPPARPAGRIAAYLAAVVIPVPGQRPSRAVTATVGVLVVGIVLIGQSLADSLRLPPGFGYVSASGFIATAEPAEFKIVTTPRTLDEAIARAKQAGRPVILDFSAEWCVECHIMDRTVFSDPVVRERLRDFEMIRADATDYNDDSRSLMKRFGVVGPPTVIFLDAGEGEEAPDTRIIGPVDAAAFLDHLNQLSVD